MPSSKAAAPESGPLELRASVSEDAYDLVSQDAVRHKRFRTTHTGILIEGFTRALHELNSRERAQVEGLLSSPADLAGILRAGLKHAQ